ncbi:hypothetical protein [Escherichia coli]
MLYLFSGDCWQLWI